MNEAIKLLKEVYKMIKDQDTSLNSTEYVAGKLKGIELCIYALEQDAK